jgi:hypothetical protein
VTLQEFPTLYATFGHQGTQDLNVILDATGAQIAIDQPANDGFFVKEFNSPGGWAALQNSDQTYGVGLYYENELGSFQGWQKAGVFNNIRSKFPFAIPAFGTVMGRAYLVLGGYGTISAEVAELQSGLAPFGLLESPAPEAVLGAPTVTLKGWALDNRGVVEVRALIDGVLVTTTTPSMDRPDVCLSWPLYPGCPQVGFEVELDLSAVSPCPHLLELEAVDTDGNARIIARQRIYPGDPPTDTPSCGDGSCNGAESAASCPSDCPSVCGDGDCVAGETNPTCPADCPPVCGDAFCDEGEVCADDCGEVEGAEEVVLLHRYFYSAGNDHDHMFGPSTVPPEGYSYEGPAFQVYEQGGPGLAPLYQSYCGACTDHLQTMSQDESSPSYVAPVLLGYVGIGQSSATPKALQRVYSAEASDHFLTANPNEASALESAGYLIEATYWAP